MANCTVTTNPYPIIIIGECIRNPKQEASIIIGLIAIAFFAVAQFPQIYKNFKLKKLPGLSPFFIILWLCGDITNLLGCILSHQLPTQTYSAIYFVCVDTISLSQIIWIKWRARRMEVLPMNNEGRRLLMVNPLPVIAVATGILSNLKNPGDMAGYIIGWISAICYMSGRFPQIIKNFKRKSTDGLSIYMFIATTTGNIIYTLSILLMSTNTGFVIYHLPWMIGAMGPLLLDIVILTQFYYFRKRPPIAIITIYEN
jgi:uncharacterized protein with PQ loop repeat